MKRKLLIIGIIVLLIVSFNGFFYQSTKPIKATSVTGPEFEVTQHIDKIKVIYSNAGYHYNESGWTDYEIKIDDATFNYDDLGPLKKGMSFYFGKDISGNWSIDETVSPGEYEIIIIIRDIDYLAYDDTLKINEINAVPYYLEAKMIQGESVEKEFTIYNIQNYTINGTLIEKNIDEPDYDCGYNCPGITILSGSYIEIPPKSNIVIKVRITSHAETPNVNYHLGVLFQKNDSSDSYQIITIDPRVKPNYSIPIIPIIIIFGILLCIIIFIIVKKKKK